MSTPAVESKERWLSARKELLAAEKEHLRQGDELARRRPELPVGPVDEEFTVEAEDGTETPGRPLRRAFAAARLSLPVRRGSPRRRREPRLHRLLVRRRPLRRNRPAPERP